MTINSKPDNHAIDCSDRNRRISLDMFPQELPYLSIRINIADCRAVHAWERSREAALSF